MPIRLKTLKEIAKEYGVDRKTFYTWRKESGIKIKRGLQTIENQLTIYQRLGLPPLLPKDEVEYFSKRLSLLGSPSFPEKPQESPKSAVEGK